jgi:flagellar biosynthesis/type III secretory pathway chaperone
MDSYQTTQCATRLYPLLEQQLKLVQAFQHYLDEIKQAISLNQTDRLQELLSTPSVELSAIEQCQLNQFQLLAEFGFEASVKGMQICIDSCQHNELSALYAHLTEQLQQLQNALMINDLLIRKNQQRIRQSIRLLSGHDIKNASMTYSSSGNTSDSTLDHRSLARA